MGATTAIEWSDATWNPVRGCARVSPGCGGPNHKGGCYAEKISARFSDPGQPFHGFAERTAHGGRWTGKVGLIDGMLDLPLRWRKPRRIFVNSMSDLFHENLPDEAIDRVFAVMTLAPQHKFQVLTKRSARLREYMTAPVRGAWAGRAHVVDDDGTEHPMTDVHLRMNSVMCDLYPAVPPRALNFASGWADKHYPDGDGFLRCWPLPNVILGVSVEDQMRADERREDLRALAAQGWRTFVSYEPVLGPVDWSGWEFLSWLISGGESGSNARPSHPDWHRTARDFCAAHGIAYFFKQWGEFLPRSQRSDQPLPTRGWGIIEPTGAYFPTATPWNGHDDDGQGASAVVWRVGKTVAGRLLDGREHSEFPA